MNHACLKAISIKNELLFSQNYRVELYIRYIYIAITVYLNPAKLLNEINNDFKRRYSVYTYTRKNE